MLPRPDTLPPVTSSVPFEHQTRAERRAQGARAAERDRNRRTLRPRPLVVAGVVVSGLVLAGAAATGERVLEVLAVVLAGLVVAAGWPRLVGSPTPVGSSVVLAVTALVLGGALFAQDSEPFLDQVPAAIAAGVVAMCLHPLVQESARAELAKGLVGTSLGLMVIACGAVLTSTVPSSSSPVVVAGIALAVAALADLATERPGTSAWMLPAGMGLGGGAAFVVHWLVSGEVAAWAALVGVLGAGTALSLRRAVSVQPAINDPAGAVAAGVASVLLVGPLLHLVSRLPIT